MIDEYMKDKKNHRKLDQEALEELGRKKDVPSLTELDKAYSLKVYSFIHLCPVYGSVHTRVLQNTTKSYITTQ